mgnify:CR=1 FL=1
MRLKGCFFRNGFPLTIASNNRPQFRFETFENYLMENGIKHRAVTPLHPAANGKIERQNLSLMKRICIQRQAK